MLCWQCGQRDALEREGSPITFAFDCAVDGEPMGRIPLTVFPATGGEVLPKFKDPSPIDPRGDIAGWLHSVSFLTNAENTRARDRRQYPPLAGGPPERVPPVYLTIA
jgi:hypothetical protein